MRKDERVLKFELEFLEKGGYGRSPREPWRPQFIFEDSPTCMNYVISRAPGVPRARVQLPTPPDLR